MKNNYSTLADDLKTILELLEEGRIDGGESLILIVLLRQTVGYKKQSDGISLSQWIKKTGLSKNTVLRKLESLKKKHLIKSQKQKTTNGGYSYTRYWLTLVPPVNKGSATIEQGLVPPVNKQVIDHTSRRERTDDYYHQCQGDDDIDGFSLLGLTVEETAKAIDSFLKKQSLAADNPSAYRAKLLSRIEAAHRGTLKEFEAHYLDENLGRLKEKYIGRGAGIWNVEDLYTYRETSGYDSRYKFLLKAVSIHTGEERIFAYRNHLDLEEAIETRNLERENLLGGKL